MVQKIQSKIHLVSCTNTHHEVTDLLNHGMVKNTKTLISWEQNITSLPNEKFLKLCLRWHILGGYCFVAEVTFNPLDQSTADLLRVVSDTIARTFNRSIQGLIYPRLLTGFDMMVFFTNLSLMEFQVRYLAFFLLLLVIEGFERFWMGSLHKNI